MTIYTRIYSRAAMTVLGIGAFTLNAPWAVHAQNDQIATAHTNSQIATETYEHAYFEDYAPRNAIDMIYQIPGFEIEDRDNSRGLGQGGANILINGARLTGKSDAEDQLNRIAASNVIRIEILDGATLNIPGLSGRIANLIVEKTGQSGVWNWTPRFRSHAEPNWGRGEVSLSGENGNLSYTFGLGINSRRDVALGYELFRNGDDILVQSSDERITEANQQYNFNADLTWQPQSGHVATLSAAHSIQNINDTSTSDRSRADTAPIADITPLQSAENYIRGEDETETQISADYSLPIGPGMFKIIGDYSQEDSPSVTYVYDYINALLDDREFSKRSQDEGERILRAEYNWETAGGSDYQFSIEGAFNYLDSFEQITRLDGSVRTDAARVEERRGEVTLTYGRALTERLDLQSSVGAEYSELSQSGEDIIGGEFVRDFVRPKGFVNLAYAVSDSLTLRSRIEREVGQLNFRDFISSVDLQNNLNTASNPDLVPEQSWIANIELDKDFGQGTRISVNLFTELIEDIVDRIPIGLTGDAIGNLPDDGTRHGIEFSSALRGDRFGFEGVQTELRFNYYDTNVKDPLTGVDRAFSRDEEYYWSLAYRHDIPNTNWAHGGSINHRQNQPTFRLNNLIISEDSKPRTNAYVEYKDFHGMKIVGRLLNLLDETDYREQINYIGRRDLSAIEATEERHLSSDIFVQFELSGTF